MGSQKGKWVASLKNGRYDPAKLQLISNENIFCSLIKVKLITLILDWQKHLFGFFHYHFTLGENPEGVENPHVEKT